MQRDALLLAIEEEIHNGSMEILEKTSSHVIAYDLDEGIELHFRTEPISKSELMNMIFISASHDKNTRDNTKANIAETRLHLPSEFFDTLRHIIILESENDMISFCKEHDIEQETSPDIIYFDDETECDTVGCKWHTESSVICNMDAIKRIAKEMVSIYPDDLSDYYLNQTLKEGFWITLFHELRHQMLECNIFLSEEDYPIDLASEEAVEQFARNTYEDYCAKGWIAPQFLFN